MEISIRPIPHGTWTPVDVDAVSCTYNMHGFTPMSMIVRRLGLDPAFFSKDSELRRWHDEKFRVYVHPYVRPLLLTTSKTAAWNDAPQATIEIIKTAAAEGCQSLCLSQFSYILGKFPAEAFQHCLQMGANSTEKSQLRRLIIDVDDRHIAIAMEVFNVVQKQQAYIRRHNLLPNRYVEFAEAGSPDYQTWLSAELLVRSSQADRHVEALKWLFLATQIRELIQPNELWINHKAAFHFLVSAMSQEEVDAAFISAGGWLAKNMSEEKNAIGMVPEFRAYRATIEAVERAK